jgi:hypothetical protein
MIMMKLVLASLLFAGCYKANIWLKAPSHPTMPSQAVHDDFEWSLFNVYQLSSPVDLATACDGGPVRIHEQVTVLGAASNIVLSYVLPLVGTMNTTVLCAARDGVVPKPAEPPDPKT